MAGNYYIDLEQFPLERFRLILETGRLLPSERLLREELDERFAVLDSLGLRNLQDLATALSTKKKRERLAQESGLPVEWLTVLRRRANTYTPKPTPLKKMPGIDPQHVDRLVAQGVKDTKQLFESARNPRARVALSERTNVPYEVILDLARLSDVSRAPYVGPAFARLLVEADLGSIDLLSEQTPEGLREQLVATNEEQSLYRAAIPSVEDFVSWLSSVRDLPQAIEWEAEGE